MEEEVSLENSSKLGFVINTYNQRNKAEEEEWGVQGYPRLHGKSKGQLELHKTVSPYPNQKENSLKLHSLAHIDNPSTQETEKGETLSQKIKK